MSAGECRLCRDLLLNAGRAIVTHLQALNRLEQAVIDVPMGNLAELEAIALETGIARENAVRAYEEHQTSHRREQVRNATS